MPREKQHQVNVNEADKLKLEKLAMRRRIAQIELIGYYIQLDYEHDIYSADWKARLDGVYEKQEREKSLKGACSRLSFDDPFYICIMGQEGKAPKIKKLSKSKSATTDICYRCPTDTRKASLRSRAYRNELHKTITEITEPYCSYFRYEVVLADDGLSFLNCGLNRDENPIPRNIENYCKVRVYGEPCGFLGEKLIGILWGKAEGRGNRS